MMRHIGNSNCTQSLANCVSSKRPQVLLSTLSARFNNLSKTKVGLDFSLKPKPQVGLFEIEQLQDASGFHLLKQNVQIDSETLVKEATSPHRTRKLVQVFDDLSDSLCRVADMADFVRVAHPQGSYRHAADDACMTVGSIVQQMNTNTELYQNLKGVVDTSDTKSIQEYDSTDRRVAKLFLNDFEQCGIHLPEKKREEFVKLTETIMALESQFQKGTNAPVRLSSSILPAYCHSVFDIIREGAILSSSYSDHPESLVREAAYRAFLAPDSKQSEILEQLIAARHRLSQLVGFNSFAERSLVGFLTSDPETTFAFMQQLSREIDPLAKQDFERLQLIKERLSGGKDSTPLQMWDASYCSSMARRAVLGQSDHDVISSYFSLGSCIEGLAMIVDKLFNVSMSLDESPSAKYELWHSTVQKLAVTCNETKELLGYIYCDLLERPDKPYMDCHFTVQGGRMKSDGNYQIAKVVLMMNLADGHIVDRPTLLSPQQVDNLFHEFGHALHSMLGRTRYQHVTGTRCLTDFAEVPSILMEYFSSDPRVLCSFARHYQTGESLPHDLASKICASKSLFSAAESQLQLFYSMFDLQLHSTYPSNMSSQTTTELLAEIQSQYYGLPYVLDTAWHLKFNHLVGYGAKYFAYLISKSIAARIWQTCFMAEPLSRENGLRYRKEILSHGGEKPPREMIQSLTGISVTSQSLVDSLVNDIKGM